MTAVVGDLASISETRSLTDQVNELGPFDAVIHNAGVYGESHCTLTVDGLPQMFVVNSLAPYILTCLIRRPKRLVYTGSGLHRSGDAALRPHVEQPAMQWMERLRGFETAQRHPCLCRCAQMARRIV
jgi:NAD(P)-dependent dehydrogenase (short-subunit alcohol dehydrogenase family)